MPQFDLSHVIKDHRLEDNSLNADGSPVSILLFGLIRPYVLGCGLISCQCDCVVCCGCARPGTI